MGTATGWNHPAQISWSLVTHWPTLYRPCMHILDEIRIPYAYITDSRRVDKIVNKTIVPARYLLSNKSENEIAGTLDLFTEIYHALCYYINHDMKIFCTQNYIWQLPWHIPSSQQRVTMVAGKICLANIIRTLCCFPKRWPMFGSGWLYQSTGPHSQHNCKSVKEVFLKGYSNKWNKYPLMRKKRLRAPVVWWLGARALTRG